MKCPAPISLLLCGQALASWSDAPAVWPRDSSAEACAHYTIQAGDTCQGIARGLNATFAQIVSWNDCIDTGCSNIKELKGQKICVSNPYENCEFPFNSRGFPITTTAAVPGPTPNGTEARCGEYHCAEDGETCVSLVAKHSITQEDFVFLNPHVGENCTSLHAGMFYCIRPVGDISTYPGYLIPTETREYVDTPMTNAPGHDEYVSNGPAIPIAEGSRRDCHRYAYLRNATDNGLADCWSLAMVHGVDAEDFVRWNPSLREENSNSTENAERHAYPCTVSESVSYCVALSSPTAAPVEESSAPPSPRAGGEIEGCTNWFRPQSPHTCETVLDVSDLTMEHFYEMNPSVRSDCSGMSPGTYYCVSTHPDGLSPGDLEPIDV